MSDLEFLEVQLRDNLMLQHSIRLFAMTNLSKDNPFKPLIEAQTCRSVNEIREVLDQLEETKSGT